MWEDTFFVFASDNGGSSNRGSDNGALKGGKGDMYEGGIMAPAFLHFGSNTVEVISCAIIYDCVNREVGTSGILPVLNILSFFSRGEICGA